MNWLDLSPWAWAAALAGGAYAVSLPFLAWMAWSSARDRRTPPASAMAGGPPPE